MDVPVKIKIFIAKPNFLTDFQNCINQINECDLEISSGKIVVAGSTDNFFDAKRIVLENGIYRSRIYYGNLDTLSEDGLDGQDFYEIHLWKKIKPESIKVIKQREYHKQHATCYNPELY